MLSSKSVNPISISGFGIRISEFNSPLRDLKSPIEVRSQENFSVSWLGWGALISSTPLPQSVVFFPA